MFSTSIDTRAETLIARTLAGDAHSRGTYAAASSLLDLGQKWQKNRDHWTALELRARAMAEGPARAALAERQEKEVGLESDAICHRIIALPARDFAELAVLLDVALEMDVEPMSFPADRPLLCHVLSELGRLAPHVEFGALRRAAALDRVTLTDPTESAETAAQRAQRHARQLTGLPVAAAAASTPAALWGHFALLAMEDAAIGRGHIWPAAESRLEEIDSALSAIRARMLDMPIADFADLAATLDVTLDIDVETVSQHAEDRPVLEHLVAQLRILAPAIEIGSLRRADSSPRWTMRAEAALRTETMRADLAAGLTALCARQRHLTALGNRAGSDAAAEPYLREASAIDADIIGRRATNPAEAIAKLRLAEAELREVHFGEPDQVMALVSSAMADARRQLGDAA